MKKKQIVILIGGKSGEHEVSLVSGLSIYQALLTKKDHFDIYIVGIDPSGRWVYPSINWLLSFKNPRDIKLSEVKNTITLLPFKSQTPLMAVEGIKTHELPGEIDVVIPILHGTNGEDGTIQGLLDLAGLCYVGPGVAGSAIGMDKDISKRLFKNAHIPVVPSLTLRRHQFKKDSDKIIEQIEEELGLPFFIKPCRAGSSVGVFKIKTRDEAKAKIDQAFLYDTKLLAEKAINAREIEVAILGHHDISASIPGEIVPSHEFYSYEAKYLDEKGADLHIPALDLSQKQISKIQDYAKDAFCALECSGLSRVDFFMDKITGEIYLNEINTLPGFTPISMYPKMWEKSGIKYPDLVEKLISLALDRHHENQNIKTTFS